MKKQQLTLLMGKAEGICVHSGVRLTKKRKRILELLLSSKIPMSAYELTDAYNQSSTADMPPMSVYRILDFLEAEQLVHKLSSANKYVACSQIDCDHSHEVPQFLICRVCQNVKEISVSKFVVDALDQQIINAGYRLMDSKLELQCLCERCMPSTA